LSKKNDYITGRKKDRLGMEIEVKFD